MHFFSWLKVYMFDAPAQHKMARRAQQESALCALNRIEKLLKLFRIHTHAVQELRASMETSLSRRIMSSQIQTIHELYETPYTHLLALSQCDFEIIQKYADTCTPKEEMLFSIFVPFLSSLTHLQAITSHLHHDNLHQPKQHLAGFHTKLYELQKLVVHWALFLPSKHNAAMTKEHLLSSLQQFTQSVTFFNEQTLPTLKQYTAQAQELNASDLSSRLPKQLLEFEAAQPPLVRVLCHIDNTDLDLVDWGTAAAERFTLELGTYIANSPNAAERLQYHEYSTMFPMHIPQQPTLPLHFLAAECYTKRIHRMEERLKTLEDLWSETTANLKNLITDWDDTHPQDDSKLLLDFAVQSHEIQEKDLAEKLSRLRTLYEEDNTLLSKI
jgi:hypothetical protein